jgi:hypothetical protein
MLMWMQLTRGTEWKVAPPRWNMMSPGSRPSPIRDKIGHAKESLKNAPGYKYDAVKATWVPV